MYVGLTRNAYKPVEQAAAKAGVPNRFEAPSSTKDLRSALGLFYFLFELLGASPLFPTMLCFAAVGDDFRTLLRDSPQYPFAFGRRGLVYRQQSCRD